MALDSIGFFRTICRDVPPDFLPWPPHAFSVASFALTSASFVFGSGALAIAAL
jgi:hypothetical protein